MRMLLCRPAAMPISAPGAPFDFPASCSLERPVKVGCVALIGEGMADGQPAGESDIPASLARHADVAFFGRGGRQFQAAGLGLDEWWSRGRLLGRCRLLLGRGLLSRGLLVRGRGRGILRRLRVDEYRRPKYDKTK